MCDHHLRAAGEAVQRRLIEHEVESCAVLPRQQSPATHTNLDRAFDAFGVRLEDVEHGAGVVLGLEQTRYHLRLELADADRRVLVGQEGYEVLVEVLAVFVPPFRCLGPGHIDQSLGLCVVSDLVELDQRHDIGR